MIDFSKYTLQELQAISDALDTLTDELLEVERDLCIVCVLREYHNASAAVEKRIAEHVRKAEEKLAALLASEPASEPAGDPPAPPDMFGWVGDALCDRCNDAERHIDSEPVVQHWISVEEELPEIGKVVLLRINCEEARPHTGFLTADGCFMHDVIGDMCRSRWKVTHWMPIPKEATGDD